MLRVVPPVFRVVLIAFFVPHTFNSSSTVPAREMLASLSMNRRLPHHQYSLDERSRPGIASEDRTGRGAFGPVGVSQKMLFHVGEE